MRGIRRSYGEPPRGKAAAVTDQALRAGFLAGYQQVCPLPADHEALLDVLMAARHVVSCCWLARRLDDPVLGRRARKIVASRVHAIRRLLNA